MVWVSQLCIGWQSDRDLHSFRNIQSTRYFGCCPGIVRLRLYMTRPLKVCLCHLPLTRCETTWLPAVNHIPAMFLESVPSLQHFSSRNTEARYTMPWRVHPVYPRKRGNALTPTRRSVEVKQKEAIWKCKDEIDQVLAPSTLSENGRTVTAPCRRMQQKSRLA